MMLSDRDKKRALAANYALDGAFRFADSDALEALWSRSLMVRAKRPGQPAFWGRDVVMEHWRRIIETVPAPDVRPKDLVPVVAGNTALVICTEDHGDKQLIATNVFVKEGWHWRMIEHRASDMSPAEDIDT